MFCADTMIKMAKYLIIFPLILVWPGYAFSQSSDESFHLWKLNSLTGEARLNGLYREQERSGSDFRDFQKSSYLSGGLLLKSSSSILHKNFLVLNIDAGYMPETKRDNYIIVPDQAEVRTMKKLGFGATFLQKKKANFHLFGDYDESYSSRENLTDIKSTNRHLGGNMLYSNKILPFNVDFHSRKWEEEEMQTGRKFKLDQKIIGARASKSFTHSDRNELRYSHDENVSVNQNSFRLANTNDNIDFVSSIALDTIQKSSLNTILSNNRQYGNLNFNRFQAGESIRLELPANLTFTGNYNFFNIHQSLTGMLQNSVTTSLAHQLFKSLRSKINFDYNSIKHSVYHEFNTKSGFDLNYTKAIPGGQLLVSYQYDRYHQNYNSDQAALNIINETYLLSDDKISLLRLPDVTASSLIIRDVTGTMVYESGLDYILIERGRFTEIRRIPGGSIPNHTAVLVDYTAAQPGAYKYDANAHVFATYVYLFKSKLTINYRFSTQNYLNLEQAELVTLNYFTQNVVGFRLDFGFVNAGAEYEDYKSSILPYRMTRYYLSFQQTLGKKLTFVLNGNLQDYVMLDEPEPKYQKYLDASGRVVYSIFKQTNLNLDLMYRKQTGRGIDLDLLTAKFEIVTSLNRLHLSWGTIIYRRNYVGEEINFKGTYIKLVRKF